jgi:hypothetical protein
MKEWVWTAPDFLLLFIGFYLLSRKHPGAKRFYLHYLFRFQAIENVSICFSFIESAA